MRKGWKVLLLQQADIGEEMKTYILLYKVVRFFVCSISKIARLIELCFQKCPMMVLGYFYTLKKLLYKKTIFYFWRLCKNVLFLVVALPKISLANSFKYLDYCWQAAIKTMSENIYKCSNHSLGILNVSSR